MGKCRNTTKGGADAPKGTSLTLSSNAGEAGDTGDVVYNLRDEVASLEEALSQMGSSSKTPFCFMWCSRLLSELSLSLEHWHSNPAYEDQMHYCVHVRVTLGEGRGDQPPPSHAWTSSLITKMFQDDLEEWITEAVDLAPGEVILLVIGNTRDDGFSLASWVNWAGREAQVERMVSTVQEGHWTIADATVEKRTKARGQNSP